MKPIDLWKVGVPILALGIWIKAGFGPALIVIGGLLLTVAWFAFIADEH